MEYPVEETKRVNSDVTINFLVDNSAGEGLIAEHGFSLWICLGPRRILFDTGEGHALAANAKGLGINLKDADMIVLSHGHYDHTGGLADVLKESQHADLYCHPGAVLPRYVIRNGFSTSIQMPKESILAIHGMQDSKIHWVTSEPLKLNDGLGITGQIPRLTDFEDVGGPFFLDEKGNRPDQIDDDQALWINTDDGLIICLGCCHAGLINTLDYIRSLTGITRVRAIIGGLHLLNADERRLERTIASLRSFSPELIVPCHCTGELATQFLGQAYGSRMLRGHSGMTLDF